MDHPSILHNDRIGLGWFRLLNGEYARAQQLNLCLFVVGDDIRTAARIIGKLLQKVKPQGAVALHISLRRNLPAIREILYRLRDHIPVLGYGANLFAGRKWDDPAVQMNKYDLADILNTYGEFGMQEVFIISEMHGTCSTAWLCARRPDR